MSEKRFDRDGRLIMKHLGNDCVEDEEGRLAAPNLPTPEGLTGIYNDRVSKRKSYALEFGEEAACTKFGADGKRSDSSDIAR